MNFRFLLAFGGFILVVGSGSLWLLYNIQKKKKLLQNLLSLPKERRFFWYLLRKFDFKISDWNTVRSFCFKRDGEKVSYSLPADFIIHRNGRKLVGIFAPEMDEAERLKLFFTYCSVYRVSGIVIYDPLYRTVDAWEK